MARKERAVETERTGERKREGKRERTTEGKKEREKEGRKEREGEKERGGAKRQKIPAISWTRWVRVFYFCFRVRFTGAVVSRPPIFAIGVVSSVQRFRRIQR